MEGLPDAVDVPIAQSAPAGHARLPHPISWGSISHGMPDFRTKMMPVKAARSDTSGGDHPWAWVVRAAAAGRRGPRARR